MEILNLLKELINYEEQRICAQAAAEKSIYLGRLINIGKNKRGIVMGFLLTWDKEVYVRGRIIKKDNTIGKGTFFEELSSVSISK